MEERSALGQSPVHPRQESTVREDTQALDRKRAQALDTWRETVMGLLGHAAWCAVGAGPGRKCDCTRAGLLSELYPPSTPATTHHESTL